MTMEYPEDDFPVCPYVLHDFVNAERRSGRPTIPKTRITIAQLLRQLPQYDWDAARWAKEYGVTESQVLAAMDWVAEFLDQPLHPGAVEEEWKSAARDADAALHLVSMKLSAINEVVHGRPVSDLEDSFTEVRQVVDLAHHNHHLDMLREKAEIACAEMEKQRDAARALAIEVFDGCTEKKPPSISEEIDSWGDGPWQDPSEQSTGKSR